VQCLLLRAEMEFRCMRRAMPAAARGDGISYEAFSY
jgi:hypothetical protein